VGKKAAHDFTSNKRQRHPVRAAPAEVLPLDSPNWMPLPDAHRLLCPLLGDRHLAAKDLTDAQADGRVRSMRRCFVYGVWREWEKGRVVDQARGYREGKVVSEERVLIGPERELLRREHWTEHELQSWSDATFVTRRSNTPASIKGYVYFVWKPDLEKIWPAVFAPAPAPPVKVQLTDKLKVQLVERPAPRRAKTPAPSQLTEDQIQELMGDVPELSDLQKTIRRYAVLKYGARWRDVDPAKVKAGAKDDPLYRKEVGDIDHHITTFRRALGRKK